MLSAHSAGCLHFLSYKVHTLWAWRDAEFWVHFSAFHPLCHWDICWQPKKGGGTSAVLSGGFYGLFCVCVVFQAHSCNFSTVLLILLLAVSSFPHPNWLWPVCSHPLCSPQFNAWRDIPQSVSLWLRSGKGGTFTQQPYLSLSQASILSGPCRTV